MLLLASEKLPCVVVCQNNQYAISTHRGQQTAASSLAVKACAYGVRAEVVDGNDVLALVDVSRQALDRARSGGGTTFIEALTYRAGPHSTSDDPTRYRSASEVDHWTRRDPIGRLRRVLVGRGLASDSEDRVADADFVNEIAAVVAEIEQEPTPSRASLAEDVYASVPWHLADVAKDSMCT
jgi:pyruvate dehydrogenase E1 component alpha subunit/2-oxoisovalerate dehydrogenase E1 component alpha subunit